MNKRTGKNQFLLIISAHDDFGEENLVALPDKYYGIGALFRTPPYITIHFYGSLGKFFIFSPEGGAASKIDYRNHKVGMVGRGSD